MDGLAGRRHCEASVEVVRGAWWTLPGVWSEGGRGSSCPGHVLGFPTAACVHAGLGPSVFPIVSLSSGTGADKYIRGTDSLCPRIFEITFMFGTVRQKPRTKIRNCGCLGDSDHDSSFVSNCHSCTASFTCLFVISTLKVAEFLLGGGLENPSHFCTYWGLISILEHAQKNMVVVHIDHYSCSCHVQACESPRDRNAAILLIRKVRPPRDSSSNVL